MRVILYGCCVVVMMAIWRMPVFAEANQDGVKITHIQAGANGDARQELIVLTNTGQEDVDISGWCLKNKSLVPIYCFSDPENVRLRYTLPKNTSAVIVSRQYADRYALSSNIAIVYVAQNQSSGALVASSDTLTLLTGDGVTADQKSWTTGWTSGYVLQRQLDGTAVDTWSAKLLDQLPINGVVESVPPSASCEPQCDSTHPKFEITEILPNPIGVDTGQEFVELYNPGADPIDLKGYTLTVHSVADKSIVIETEVTIPPLSYGVLIAETLKVTLPNTHASVSITTKDGTTISKGMAYEKPPDGQSWSRFDDSWAYTDQVTPGEDNKSMPFEEDTEEDAVVSYVSKPCAVGQYRHPETNRCRLLVTQGSITQAVCQEGYYRHPDTGRCRKVAATSSLVACKEGQERNAETGRCRTIRQIASVNHGVLQAKIEEKPQQWYIVGVIIAAVVGLIAYGIWEWRHDIKRLFVKFPKFSIGHK
jgi:hypothetical protein